MLKVLKTKESSLPVLCMGKFFIRRQFSGYSSIAITENTVSPNAFPIEFCNIVLKGEYEKNILALYMDFVTAVYKSDQPVIDLDVLAEKYGAVVSVSEFDCF